ncbi:hypothetical protein [uncultured Nonlabens sp.]|uniref:hypothetical protein n=1 Tax=uncultured Nonlabens sp. TaxID=859306 RepID=UPI002619CE57|nr:hypothetical protein [uncultured Nonlabens sp.]
MKKLIFTLLVIIAVQTSNAQSSQLTEDQFREKVTNEFQTNYNKTLTSFENSMDYDIVKKNEKWNIYEFDNKRIFKIESKKNNTTFIETYYEVDGLLRYAQEKEISFINTSDAIEWNCEYFLENGAVKTIMSLGHGKTERDDWDSSEVLTMYQKRKALLKQ